LISCPGGNLHPHHVLPDRLNCVEVNAVFLQVRSAFWPGQTRIPSDPAPPGIITIPYRLIAPPAAPPAASPARSGSPLASLKGCSAAISTPRGRACLRVCLGRGGPAALVSACCSRRRARQQCSTPSRPPLADARPDARAQ